MDVNNGPDRFSDVRYLSLVSKTDSGMPNNTYLSNFKISMSSHGVLEVERQLSFNF